MKHIFLLFVASLVAVVCRAGMPSLRFYQPLSLPPSNDVLCLLLDHKGLIWIGTNSGLKSYDGYTTHDYRSSAITPGLLPNNTINCMTEGTDDMLWLGTNNGVVGLDRRTGDFHPIHLPKENQRVVYCLATSTDGTVWIGTDGGLSIYQPQTHRLTTLDSPRTMVVEPSGRRTPLGNYSVKSILDDGRGHIFIGTWNTGLLRLDRRSGRLYRYPSFNDRHSAHSLYFDHQRRLWVGTWCRGLVRLDRPYDPRDPGIHQYPYLPQHFDTYYMMTEDPVSHTLWACSREGVSVIDLDNPDMPWNNMVQANGVDLDFSNGVVTDGLGNLWIATASNGIVQATTRPPLFHNWTMAPQAQVPVNAVLSLATADGRWFWLGLRPYGLALYDRATGRTLYGSSIPGFASLPKEVMAAKIASVIHRANGETWFASGSYGIVVRTPDGQTRQLTADNTPFLVDNFVCTLYEDRQHRVWIGQRKGLSCVLPDGHGAFIPLREKGRTLGNCDVRGIIEDRRGTLWVATVGEGIIAVTGDPRRPASIRCHQYSPERGNLVVDGASTCYEDSHGRLWAVSSDGGLFLYDRRHDRFVAKNADYHIPGSQAFAIIEDRRGCLWLTTETALVRLDIHDEAHADVISFTASDGIDDLLFSPNAVTTFGDELFFGNRTGFFSFRPLQFDASRTLRHRIPMMVTDILVDGESLDRLDSAQRRAVSAETPQFTRELTFGSHVRKIGIEVALLSYINVGQSRYAFWLEGYSQGWNYTNDRVATYQNLSPGTYYLHVKAANSLGVWQELPYTLTIHILPPWYATWWARMLWLLLVAGLVVLALRWYQAHLRTRNRLQMAVIFTNITHELLTPLTVISASVDEMQQLAPQLADHYKVIKNNISQISRLLRQILEVRKAQAGQLRLLVSRGSLTQCVSSVCESMRPMEQLHHNRLEVNLLGDVVGWFDSDKVNKILSNLVSNAFKYNKEGGRVMVSLRQRGSEAVITVADEGIGIDRQRLKHLYTRFLDGDYRRVNTVGTGIGLSLTHDLVILHHGHIDCHTKEGEGTRFVVTIPMRRSAYAPEEIDKQVKGGEAIREMDGQMKENGTGREVDGRTGKNASGVMDGQMTSEKAISADVIDGETPAHSSHSPHSPHDTPYVLSQSPSEEKQSLRAAAPLEVIKEQATSGTVSQDSLGDDSHKVLIVEDNDELLRLMERLLAKRYEVRTARNGQQAWNIIQREELDIVVSDVMMPVMDGIELTRRIKHSKDYAQLPVILLTAKTSDDDRDTGYNSGADDYLTKPFRLESLQTHIDSIMANRKRIRERYLREMDDDKSPSETALHLSDPAQLFLDKARDCVMAHLGDSDFDREAFAREMLVSSSTLYNKLRALTGMSITEYANSIRLHEAKRILEHEPSLSITEVAARVGFNTPRYFSRLFKKQFGRLPKEK